MNLILAVVWFTLGVGVLVWEFVTGDQSLRLHALGNISPGWLAFPMCLYNLARWASERAYRRDLQAIHQANARRERFHPRDREPGSDIDPNFDFTSDKPQQPPRQDITDQPPTKN
jgi:hypothetical protein